MARDITVEEMEQIKLKGWPDYYNEKGKPVWIKKPQTNKKP